MGNSRAAHSQIQMKHRELEPGDEIGATDQQFIPGIGQWKPILQKHIGKRKPAHIRVRRPVSQTKQNEPTTYDT